MGAGEAEGREKRRLAERDYRWRLLRLLEISPAVVRGTSRTFIATWNELFPALEHARLYYKRGRGRESEGVRRSI